MPLFYILLGVIIALLGLWVVSRQAPRRAWRTAVRTVKRLSPKWRENELHALSEDVLKSLYKQLVGELASDVSIVDTVEPERQFQLTGCLSRLQKAGLIEAVSFQLTARGQEEAVRIIARHRLYETYLSERTGLPEKEWHAAAEQMEHKLDDQAASVLARKLGYPRFDPHGDPIPQPDGEVPRRTGCPLGDMPQVQGWVEVTGLQDSPAELYAQLREKGLYPGALVEVLGLSDGQFQLRIAGANVYISSGLAMGIFAQQAVAPPPANLSLLSDLRPGVVAEVYGITPGCRGAIRRRLLDLGFVRGSSVRVDLQSPLRNPTGYLIRGTTIALRRDQAEHIQVLPKQEESAYEPTGGM